MLMISLVVAALVAAPILLVRLSRHLQQAARRQDDLDALLVELFPGYRS